MEHKKINQEIDEFLDGCLRSQQEFLNRINKLSYEIDTFKYKTVSKYHISQAGMDTFNQRIRRTFLARLRQLRIDYVTRLETLQVEYDEMMKDHLQLSEDWKKKREKYPAWYANLTKQVLDEKADFRSKVENNCLEIQEASKTILNRLMSLYSEDEINTDSEVKKHKTFLVHLSQDTADTWMEIIMSYEKLSF